VSSLWLQLYALVIHLIHPIQAVCVSCPSLHGGRRTYADSDGVFLNKTPRKVGCINLVSSISPGCGHRIVTPRLSNNDYDFSGCLPARYAKRRFLNVQSEICPSFHLSLLTRSLISIDITILLVFFPLSMQSRHAFHERTIGHMYIQSNIIVC